eukprot:13663381-Heterocapsa_arctica.AAC.1
MSFRAVVCCVRPQRVIDVFPRRKVLCAPATHYRFLMCCGELCAPARTVDVFPHGGKLCAPTTRYRCSSASLCVNVRSKAWASIRHAASIAKFAPVGDLHRDDVTDGSTGT